MRSESLNADSGERLRLWTHLTPAKTKEDREREFMDAQWALLLAESGERAERARERLKRRNQQPPTDDIDKGLERLEQTIANMTPSDDETFRRTDATLKRIVEKLKETREIQKRTSAMVDREERRDANGES